MLAHLRAAAAAERCRRHRSPLPPPPPAQRRKATEVAAGVWSRAIGLETARLRRVGGVEDEDEAGDSPAPRIPCGLIDDLSHLQLCPGVFQSQGHAEGRARF